MGSDSGTNTARNDIFVSGQAPPSKPKGLLDAISEIQQYYVVEKTGSEIPAEFFTITGQLAFFGVGFKDGLISGLVSTLLSPFTIGVLDRYVPIFGSTNPSWFDTSFAFFLSISFTLGYAMFYGGLGKYYIGGVSKSAIKNLLSGLAAGAVVKTVFAVILFHYIYLYAFEPTNLQKFLWMFSTLVSYDILNAIYIWIGNFRPVLLTASYLVIFTMILMIGIPLISIILGNYKTRRAIEAEQKWL